jgi:hypothetical protein
MRLIANIRPSCVADLAVSAGAMRYPPQLYSTLLSALWARQLNMLNGRCWCVAWRPLLPYQASFRRMAGSGSQLCVASMVSPAPTIRSAQQPALLI